MSVEFVIGRPSGSADTYVDNRITDVLREDPASAVYVITPRQSTFGVEEELFRTDGMQGHLGLDVTSPERLADSVLSQVYGGAGEAIDSAGKSMAVRRILDRHKGELRAFSRIAAGAQLPTLITEQIGRIRRMDITAGELSGYAEKTGNARFHDLAVVYGALEEELAGRTDVDARLDTAIEHIRDAWFIRQAKLVVVRGFSSYTAQQIRFIEELMKTAPDTIVLFSGTPEGAPDEAVYRASLTALSQLQNVPLQKGGLTVRRIADPTDREGPPDILHASHFLFSHGRREKMESAPSMTVGEAVDPEQEVRAAAAEIVRMHLEEGVSFSEIAVVWGDTDEYEPLIRRIFSEAHIPYFTGEQKTLADSNLAEFVLTAAELAMGDLRKDSILAHAATGFTKLDADAQGMLQNYAYSKVSWGRQFEKPFRQDETDSFRDDAEAAEEARQLLMRPVTEYLRRPLEGGKERSAEAVFGAIETYLDEVLTEETIAERALSLGDSYEQASFLEQTYRSTRTIVRQARQMLQGSTLEPGEARRILQAGFEAVRLSLVPAGVDEVQAGNVQKTYVPEVKALFVLGVNDEVLPKFAQTSRDILTTLEWSALLQDVRGIEIPSASEEQKFHLIRAMRQARGRIHWSYHVSGGQKPSVILRYLDGIFERPVERADLAARAAYLKQNAFDTALRQIRSIADGAPVEPDPGFLSRALFDEEFSERIRRLKTSLAPAEQPVPAPGLRVPRSISSTRLSRFYNCPYQHFLEYQLGIWQPSSADLDVQGAGTYIHGALEGISKRIRALEDQEENPVVKWSDLPEPEFEEIVDQVLSETRVKQMGPEPFARTQAAAGVLDSQIRRTAVQLREQYAHGGLAPYASEYPFYLPESGLTGLIDRIDAVRLADTGQLYYSVVDYKSGAAEFRLEDIMSGTRMQLLVYLLALEELIRSGRIEPGQLAGAGFLQVLMGESREKNPVWWKEYRMDGFVAVPADTAARLYGRGNTDTNDSLYSMNMLLKKNQDAYYSTSAAGRLFLPETTDPRTGLGVGGDFGALMGCARHLAADAASRIREGDNRIEPYEGSKGIACQFCEYKSICGFDKALPGMHARHLSTTASRGLRQLLTADGEKAGAEKETK